MYCKSLWVNIKNNTLMFRLFLISVPGREGQLASGQYGPDGSVYEICCVRPAEGKVVHLPCSFCQQVRHQRSVSSQRTRLTGTTARVNHFLTFTFMDLADAFIQATYSAFRPYNALSVLKETSAHKIKMNHYLLTLSCSKPVWISFSF